MLNFAFPAEQIVYTDDTRFYGQLTGPDYPAIKAAWPRRRALPAAWTDFMTLAGIPVPLVQAFPGRSGQLPMLSRPGFEGICFLGELTSAGGVRKLVVVDCVQVTYAYYGGRSPMSMTLQAFSVEPATHLAPPGPMVPSPSVARLCGGWEGAPFNVTVFAGKRDPNDPSRFTIRFMSKETTSVIDGRLGDDGDVVFAPSDPLDNWPYRGGPR